MTPQEPSPEYPAESHHEYVLRLYRRIDGLQSQLSAALKRCGEYRDAINRIHTAIITSSVTEKASDLVEKIGRATEQALQRENPNE